ncbi:hypothetical protein HDU76_008125 [Blyttiomyces sp. JEL0837]|nr:hypothetical protein HDU76_008125 [Blyttiomyces sp. JEL0837]
MISFLSWVPKGAAQETPEKFKLDDERYAQIQEQIASKLEQSRSDLEQAEADAMVADQGSSSSKKTGKNAGKEMPVSAEDEAIIKEFNLDTYDDDEEDEAEDIELDEDEAELVKEAVADAPLFGNIKGLTYHGSNQEDPYVTMEDKVDEDEELEEMMIAKTDNLILAAKTEDDVSHIEVYLYETGEDNLFVHHDIMLPSFPLCLEWLNFPMGRKAGKGIAGNYVAVGTFDPEIEIWDLDLLDAVYPEAILGGQAGANPVEALGTGKKKKRSKKPSADHHVDAVMCLAWNKPHPNLLASGSADMTVKLWDLSKPEKAVRSYNTHSAKVQAVVWNPQQSEVLLTGGYDKRACVFDSRAPNAVSSFTLSADVEAAKWDPFKPERFLVSTEDGLVRCYDGRNSGSNPIYTIHAHDAAVSALDISATVPGLIATGSADKTVKIWSTKDDQLKCLVSRDLNVGKVFAANFCPDSDLLLAVAGGKGTMTVWNLEGNLAVRSAVRGAQAAAASKVKEFTTVDADDEEDEDGEMEMVGDDAMEEVSD